MQDRLRRQYQVSREVSRNGYFEGELPFTDFDRLNELFHPDFDATDSKVTIRFEFVNSEYDLPVLSGSIRTQLLLECQRCLGSVEFPVELDFRLMIDASDELVRESSLETLYSDDGYIDIVEAVEDELILSIPLVVMHDDESCNKHMPSLDTPAEARKDNPFSVLKQLKTSDLG